MQAAHSLPAAATLMLIWSLAGCGAATDATLSQQVAGQALVSNNCRMTGAQSSQKGCRPLEGMRVAVER
jgi:uncharacterized protein YceK